MALLSSGPTRSSRSTRASTKDLPLSPSVLLRLLFASVSFSFFFSFVLIIFPISSSFFLSHLSASIVALDLLALLTRLLLLLPQRREACRVGQFSRRFHDLSRRLHPQVSHHWRRLELRSRWRWRCCRQTDGYRRRWRKHVRLHHRVRGIVSTSFFSCCGFYLFLSFFLFRICDSFLILQRLIAHPMVKFTSFLLLNVLILFSSCSVSLPTTSLPLSPPLRRLVVPSPSRFPSISPPFFYFYFYLFINILIFFFLSHTYSFFIFLSS